VDPHMQKKEYIVWVILVLVFGGVFFTRVRSAQDSEPATALIAEETFLLEIADTTRERAQGLSNRAELADHGGMLFVFDEVSYHGFWMKDTLIPLDIIWLDENRRVVGITQNATPDSYPEVFYPDAPALFVIEVPAGTISRLGVGTDNTITIIRQQ